MSSREKKSNCSLCRIINMLITVALLGVGGYVIWYFLGQPSGEDIANTFGNIDFGDFSDVLENFTGIGPDLWNTDPFVGDNTTFVWRGTDGVGGLDLEMLNALDDTWQSEYAEAVNDWDNCNPDALTLTTQQVAVDNACTQVDGVMKVCNGNYGETGWLGINEILKTVPNQIIQSSVAKMNEYYLNNAGYEERLYTMCHEIGHGFGLPHTDENFMNADLGNCLDYTNSPRNNLRPGEYNCNRLKTMYGTVDGAARRLERWLRGGNTGDDNVYELQQYRKALEQYQKEPVNMQDETFASKYERAMKELSTDLLLHRRNLKHIDAMPVENEWRILHEHPRGGAFVRRLNPELALEVHVLYPRN
mmetsp:Transcript_32771/g.54929  ORF Transcript_32771/g.54929 Transcript_32771/m.54929 type:complete len:361 (-) Transcript_32771:242-1324(-)|eukprot:CAMPEP_0178754284 /NCGR_PEP_ID=MMETSP0744-20121128/12076_1 /TAXON_ID=913974 /ORGANISM="Nitzschia punctata, Strain CCMP561" /LENGTH=360 /DNA_ID=CAMNT_0020408183 /DNA_START=364 /DNA_END=1446 /DNA_ORIENTATION=+